MQIERVGTETILLIVDEGTLDIKLIQQALDLCYEIGSCKALIAIVGVDELRSKPDIFSDRWVGAGLDNKRVKLRLEIRRAIPNPDTPEPPRPRLPARVPGLSRLTQPARKKLADRRPKRRKVKA
jgi:hypothetical protein